MKLKANTYDTDHKNEIQRLSRKQKIVKVLIDKELANKHPKVINLVELTKIEDHKVYGDCKEVETPDENNYQANTTNEYEFDKQEQEEQIFEQPPETQIYDEDEFLDEQHSYDQ